MLLRKTNAVIGILTTVLLLGHAISLSVFMLSGGSVTKPSALVPWVLAGLLVTHAMICMELAVSSYEGIEKRKCKVYPKMNAATLFQRISGILLIVFTALHIAGASGYMTTPKAVHIIIPPLFFTVALAHAAVSTSKAFITLGIGNTKFIKIIDVIIKVICALTLIAAISAFYLYSV